MSSNPLSNFFRQPAIHLKLPSRGKFWPDNTLDLPVTGEIPIYPMTTKDEITLRTPDALLNGSGVVELIHSCCPNVSDAWSMPSIDVDAVIIAIRIASYGQNMDFDNRCPHCKEENTHSLDLTAILDNLKVPDFQTPVKHNGLTFRLKPQSYFSLNETNKQNFEEQQLLRNTAEIADEEEKLRIFNEQLQRIIVLSIKLVTDCTECIVTPDGIKVTDQEHIKEFYERAESRLVNMIRDHISTIVKDSAIPDVTVNCGSCEKEYTINLTFDYSSFFGKGF